MFIRKCLDRGPEGGLETCLSDEQHRWVCVCRSVWVFAATDSLVEQALVVSTVRIYVGGKGTSVGLTLALSITLENSPIQTKQCSGVTNRKQSPLFKDEALGSTNLV